MNWLAPQRLLVAALPLTGVVLAACAGVGSETSEVHGGTGAAQIGDSDGSAVVSTVDGVRVTLDEVKAAVSAGGLTPPEALRRLQARALLAAEAERLGYGGRPEVALAFRQALVQEVLTTDEARINVSQETLAQAYGASTERFQVPERRASTHVLAKYPRGAEPNAEQLRAGKAFAEKVIGRLDGAQDVAAVLEQLKTEKSPHFQVVVENLPAVARDGGFVPEFLKALFEPASAGLVPTPVRTSFGYHAVIVTEIIAARYQDLAEAAPLLKPELLVEGRRAQHNELLVKLAEDNPPQWHPEMLQRLAELGE